MTRTIRVLFTSVAVAMGLAFILGGPTRVSVSAYMVVQETGGPYVWGAWFLVCGVLTAVAPRGGLRWALLLGASAFAVLCAAFTLAAITSPTANFTGTVAYAFITVLHAMASERVREERSWTLPCLPRSVAG